MRSLLLFDAECGAGMRARQRGNFGFAETFGFLLRGQKKVTKEEALNRTRAGRHPERRSKTNTFIPSRRDPLRSRGCPCDESYGAPLQAA
jgi:hypothetical protein